MTGENGKQQNVTFWGNPEPQCKRLEGQDLEVVEETPCQNVPPCEGEEVTVRFPRVCAHLRSQRGNCTPNSGLSWEASWTNLQGTILYLGMF